jgi:hypothetical protein
MASIIGSLFRGSSLLGSAKSLVNSGNNSRIGDVVIDAALSEVIQYSSSITEHPIEDKTALSDHIVASCKFRDCSGSVTDNSINSPSELGTTGGSATTEDDVVLL